MNTKTKIRDIRVEQGISQEALAEIVNVSRQTISKWENGTVSPSAENLAALSKAFGMPVDALLNDDWTPPKPEIQTVEVPMEVRVEVPVPVEVPRPRDYRLVILLAALALAAGIFIGVFFFRGHEDVVPVGELESEVIDFSENTEGSGDLISDTELDISDVDHSVPVINIELLPPSFNSSDPK